MGVLHTIRMEAPVNRLRKRGEERMTGPEGKILYRFALDGPGALTFSVLEDYIRQLVDYTGMDIRVEDRPEDIPCFWVYRQGHRADYGWYALALADGELIIRLYEPAAEDSVQAYNRRLGRLLYDAVLWCL